MKKLLLLLLFLPYLAIAQSADATPIENILLTNAAEKSAATRVTVQDATTKELGFILKSTLNTNISIGNKNENTFQILSSTGSGPVVPSVTTTEAGLSTASDKVLINTIAHTGATGLNEGGLLTINTDAAKFDLSAGFGYVVNGHSDPDNTTYTKVNWTAKIANVIPNLDTQKQTYVAVDINGDLFLTNVPLTATQRRNYIRIGVLIHLNNSAVTYIDNQPTVNIEIGGQVQDILEALGFRSLSGNRVFPVSNNLKIKKELGRVFKSGANFDNLTTQPHSFTLAAQEPITFRYRTQTGAEGADITDITPSIYDLNGTITPVAATATLATIQRVYIFQDGVIRIQPGQRVFTTLNAAITAINSDFFITDLDIAENGLYLGAIVLTRNAVDLSNISQVIFAPSIGTTANGSVASPALGYTAEDVANKQNNLAVDGTGAKYTTVDAVNSGLDTKINSFEKGAVNGVATLDGSGKVPLAQINDALLGSVNYKGTYNATTNAPALPAAGASNKGFYYIVSTAGTQFSLVLNVGDWIISNGSEYGKVDNNNAVTSVAGRVGAIVLSKTDVGLSNVENTSDLNKVISTATQTVLDSKISGSGTTNQLAKFTSSRVVGNSLLNDDGTGIRYLTGVNSSDISYGIGKELSSGNSVFFGWRYNLANPYGFIDTFAGASPLVLQSSSGKVGVGTTTPTEKLDVLGNGKFSGNLAASKIEVTNNTGFDLISSVSGSIFNSLIADANANASGLNFLDTAPFRFSTSTNKSGAGFSEKMRIQNNNLGINQPNPTEKLDVVGNGKFSGTVTASPATVSTELATLGQLDAKENVSNKQNSLAVDDTGAKYTTVDAVNVGLSGKANIASPALTGTPTAPTATEGTNTTQIATTAYVGNQNKWIETSGKVKNLNNNSVGINVLDSDFTSVGTDNNKASLIVKSRGVGATFPIQTWLNNDGSIFGNLNSNGTLSFSGRLLIVKDINIGDNSFIGTPVGSGLRGGTNNGIYILSQADRWLLQGGGVTSPDYRLSALNIGPASATATGVLGEIRITATFIYICTATNTWVRSALSTW
jgi:hypothetical protein